jgi:8-oxo-dGTP pyrophosphatase MutT (NUDIX family)
VLALFIDDPDFGISLLFTRRSIDLRSHAGQVGFPGGRREVWDESPVVTALRESEEEVALPRDKVTIVGTLPFVKALDGKAVLPVVGYADIAMKDLIANPSEVAEIFCVPWQELTAEKKRILRFNIFGKWRETPHFEANGHHVWGLTAWMIDKMKLGS